MDIPLTKSREDLLSTELSAPYFQHIQYFLLQEIQSGKIIYPYVEQIFTAFNSTPLNNLKIVILGQDPYHGEGQAHGLSFSVQENIRIPPSLKNIYKEIKTEYPYFNIPNSGNLNSWANQGVLMLNSILTVEKSLPASHSKIGWELFTDAVIKKISDSQEGIIFVLWGKYSISKKVFINTDKHLVLESAHPSPFSAYKGFFGNNHFKQINAYLKKNGKTEIRW